MPWGQSGNPSIAQHGLYCPIKCPQHTFTQCCCFSHWRNTEVNPLCWGMWCHSIVIYRKRQQLWLGVSKEWHATDCSCNAIPWPPCNSSCRCRERFFLHSSWGSQSAEWSLHLAKCSCQLWLGPKRACTKVKEQSLLCQYRNLSHTKSLSRKGTVEIPEIQAGAGKFWWKHHSSDEVADKTARK